MLRLANSPLYGLEREIRGLGHAATVLGVRQLRSLALSVAGGSMFADGATAAGERKALWEHSLACATVGRLLAESVGVAADDAFLGGIFHDVGTLLLFDLAPGEYADLARRRAGTESVEAEKFMLGMSHDEIGLKSAHSWGLSENLKAAIGYHHDPEEAPAHTAFVKLLDIANRLSKAWGLGAPADPNSDIFASASEDLDIDS